MARQKALLLTVVAMLAFAGNSLICRQALRHTGIDAASFTAVRIVSGAIVLALLVRGAAASPKAGAGSWTSALALFAYAAAFSFAYVGLTAATGALLLFGAVQATMIGVGLARGERIGLRKGAGLTIAALGLVALLLPGLAAPPWQSALLMLAAGVAWGGYSVRGRGAGDPTRVTAGNFARAVLPALALCAATAPWCSFDRDGVMWAVASGALTSGCGYVVWYAALKGLKATTAATVQLCVPVLATLGGIAFLHEPATARLLLSSVAVLGGIAIVLVDAP